MLDCLQDKLSQWQIQLYGLSGRGTLDANCKAHLNHGVEIIIPEGNTNESGIISI